MDKSYYLRFPSVLRGALESGQVAFGEDVSFAYNPFSVFRGITREPEESIEIRREDFFSYAELGRKPRGKKNPEIGWYSCSCFLEKDELEQALKLPRFNRKIIEGTLKEEYGPQRTNEETKHVDWWVYQDAVFEQEFKVI